MAQKPDEKDMHKALFANLVMMLAASCMQQLGKIIDPMTGKTEVNLEAAQATIDLLEMLKAKTAGNRDKDEDRLMTDTLATLQLNYVETAQAAPAAAAEPSPAAAPPAGDAPAAKAPPAGGPTGKPDAQDPKFHKTYG